MPRKRPRRVILFALLAILAAAPLVVRAAVPLVELVLGDKITVTCPTRLSSVVEGDQMTLRCLPSAPDLYRVSVPWVVRSRGSGQ